MSRLAGAAAFPMGGGTDLLVTIDEEIVQPAVVVDVSALPDGRGGRVQALDDGRVRIDASISLSALSRDAVVRDRFPALAQACDTVATPALRNMGTLGGNLCQRPRCWYFRRGIPCLKHGGSTCPAHNDQNQYLAILDGGPCWAVHPSDPAVALTALDAVVQVASAAGLREVPISEFYILPSVRADRETILEPGDLVVAVTLPAEAAGGRQLYEKLMQRDAWDFALASVAASRREDGDVRIVLGGVAPRPWRVNSSVEEDVSSGGLDDDAIDTLAGRALLDAAPLSRNGYKVDLAAALLRQSMKTLGGSLTMPWLAIGRLTYELGEGVVIVGSGADADWHVDFAELMPRHFTVTVNGRVTTVAPFSDAAVIAIDGSQAIRANRLVDGAIISAGSGRFVYSQDNPRVVAAETVNGTDAYLIESLAGIAHPLNNRSTSIGRDASNVIVVRNPTASRFHADVRREAGGFAIHSMGSAGTVMNGKLMKQPVLLDEGDTIEIAFTVFEFTMKAPPPDVTIAPAQARENDEASRKPTIQTEWVVDEEGNIGEAASPVPAILGLIWFLVFTGLAYARCMA